MKAELTLTDVGVLLSISKRQVQRLIQHGELCGYINGQGKRVIRREDLQAFEQRREAVAQVSATPGVAHSPEPSVAPGATHPPEPCPPNSGDIPQRPAHLRPSDPNAPLTNVPTENSSNWASRTAMVQHEQQEHIRMVAAFRGEEKPHEYPNDFEI